MLADISNKPVPSQFDFSSTKLTTSKIFTPIKNEVGKSNEKLNMFNQADSLPKSNSSDKQTDTLLRQHHPFNLYPMHP